MMVKVSEAINVLGAMVMLIRALLVFTDTSGCIEAERAQKTGRTAERVVTM